MARLLDRLGVAIDLAIAENLYAGLATDTGHFRHADSDAHRLAARLIDTGVRPADLLRPITDSHPFGWFAMLSQVLGRAVLDPAGGRRSRTGQHHHRPGNLRRDAVRRNWTR